MRHLPRQFVNDDLVTKEHVTVNKRDRAYFPTSRDIRNYMHCALVAGQFSGLDEENLQKKVAEWKETDPSANVSLRLCTEAKSDSKNGALQTETDRGFTTNQSESDDEYDAGETTSNQFLFIHQSAAQKRILPKYDNTVLFDATYTKQLSIACPSTFTWSGPTLAT